MADERVLECDLGSGWKLLIDHPHRDRGGRLVADLALANGKPRTWDPVTLNEPEARESWAAGAGAETGLDAAELGTTLVELLPQVVASLQTRSSAGTAESGAPFRHTDMGNAERLVARHGPDFRWCPPQRSFVLWDGKRWTTVGAAEKIEGRAKATVRSLYAEAAELPTAPEREELVKHALASERAQRIRAMIELVRSEPGVQVMPDVFDTDPLLFNCSNGTIDLRTGELRPHQRDDLLTKVSPVEYDPDATAPRFVQFLSEIMDGDQELISFLQRAFGYTLTGATGEECLFFCYGTGRNGKSKLLSAIEYVMGEYAKPTRPETIMAKRGGEIPNDVAALAGTRFVPTIEVQDGKRLAENVVKQLTGGDRVSARFLFREYFEFRPQFKVWLAANHKPVIKGTDIAIWARIKLVPFAVTIPENQRDKKLGDKLQVEAAGILRWMVEGCLEWQRVGLVPPQRVTDATAEYRQEMDILGAFLNECCTTQGNPKAQTTDLYRAYAEWCQANGETEVTQTKFSRELTERGYRQVQEGQARSRTWQGIGLLVNGLK